MRHRTLAMVAALTLALVACAGTQSAAPEDSTTTTEAITTTTLAATTTTEGMDHDMGGGDVDTDVLLPAYVGAAAFQDVSAAEAAGWVSTLETLGCFENPEVGGMGVHWLNESLLDAEVAAGEPEALVYELDADGEVAGLVGHEYLVPFEAWTSDEPPTLFGLDFHEHPVLPFWILHAYLWKDNPLGMFNDWNPKVRMCPDGVPVFGVDLP